MGKVYGRKGSIYIQVKLYCPRCKTLMKKTGSIYVCKCSSWWNCDVEYNLWKRYILSEGWTPVQQEELPIKSPSFIFR
jgi:hypothetical protein